MVGRYWHSVCSVVLCTVLVIILTFAVKMLLRLYIVLTDLLLVTRHILSDKVVLPFSLLQTTFANVQSFPLSSTLNNYSINFADNAVQSTLKSKLWNTIIWILVYLLPFLVLSVVDMNAGMHQLILLWGCSYQKWKAPVSFFVSVRVSALIGAAYTDLIFETLHIGDFYKNLSRNSRFLLKSDKNIGNLGGKLLYCWQ